MQRSDLRYDLPPELIAQEPLADRSAGRLLLLDAGSGHIEDLHFRDLPQLLDVGDLLVFNDTRVLRARLLGRKQSGGQVELLIERVLSAGIALAHVRASRAPGAGTLIELERGFRVRIAGREDDLFQVEFLDGAGVHEVLDAIGHVPLPPYIDRADNIRDQRRYQTVFGRSPGAVAAPTAGLHFDEDVLRQIELRGIDRAFITLHVGSGTFQPLRVERLAEHRMHSEYCEINETAVEKVLSARARGNRVVAVGTTAVRTLETASLSGTIAPFRGDTRLFIVPGFQFRCVDAMLTNFHLPESTLLALVCAFAGYRNTMAAYRHAVAGRYRFFSYGDAMLVMRPSPNGREG